MPKITIVTFLLTHVNYSLTPMNERKKERGGERRRESTSHATMVIPRVLETRTVSKSVSSFRNVTWAQLGTREVRNGGLPSTTMCMNEDINTNGE